MRTALRQIDSYVHTQATPANTWSIQHNLRKQVVTAVLFNTEGDEIGGRRDNNASTANLLVYRFDVPVAGTAHII